MAAPNESSAGTDRRPTIAVLFPPPVSGIMGNVFASDIVRILAPLSKKIWVVAVFRPSLPDDEKVQTITMTGYGSGKWLVVKGIRFVLMQLKGCCHVLRLSRDADVFMFHIASGMYLLPLMLARLLGKRTIYCHTGLYSKIAAHRYQGSLLGLGGALLPRVFAMLEWVAFHLASLIVVESESVISFAGMVRYRKKIAVAPARVIDTDALRPTQDLDKRNGVGYIGRLDGEKGVAGLARAFASVSKQRPDLKFLIAGEGPLLAEVTGELESAQARHKVDLPGWIPHDEMATYLNRLKLFVLPSYTEGLPGTLLEAMACGTPVLATAVGGVPDIVIDDETGFIMRDNSPECIAKGILRALDSPRLEEIVQNARALVAENYRYETVVEAHRRVLVSLQVGHAAESVPDDVR